MKNYDVSIIVPIYNVEKFIAKCVTTLMEQDYRNIEYIFVNDCTPDNSMQVLSDTLAKYPNRKEDIKIINNTQNSGSSITRKNGLDIANGEYILFIDSDDWVELNMVSSMLKKAKETNADIVCCDYFVNFQNKEIKKIYLKQYKNILIDKEKILIDIVKGSIDGFLCLKLIKRSLYNNVEFPKFSYLEDCYLTTQLFYYAENIKYVQKYLYHYNQINSYSITTNSVNKNLQNDLKQYFDKMNSFLEYKNLQSLKEYLYISVIYAVLSINAYNNINIISPNANKIIYLWKNDKVSFSRKIFFSLPFFHSEWLLIIFRKAYSIVKKRCLL